MKHDWKEHKLDPFVPERRCALQTFKCRLCAVEAELPMGMHPTDYDETICRGEIPKVKWKAPIRDRTPKKADYPARKAVKT